LRANLAVAIKVSRAALCSSRRDTNKTARIQVRYATPSQRRFAMARRQRFCHASLFRMALEVLECSGVFSYADTDHSSPVEPISQSAIRSRDSRHAAPWLAIRDNRFRFYLPGWSEKRLKLRQ